MRRRRYLHARLDRLDPPTTQGGVIYFEDLQSGTVTLENMPMGRGGYLLVHRPCRTKDEWVKKYGGVRPLMPIPSR